MSKTNAGLTTLGEGAAGRGLGARVRERRRTQGWSQTELALRAGVSRPTIARIEGGQHVLMGTLEDVARTLDLRLELRGPEAKPSHRSRAAIIAPERR